jgi:hypothetical protein
MTWAIARHGQHGDFLAHIGGDDFVAMVSPDTAERICKAVVRCFKRLILNCYHPQDRDRGWIMGKGRDGKEQQFPLVSVSIGIVECATPCSLQALGEKAAQVKGYAKSLPGNVYVRDRRGQGANDPSPKPAECAHSSEPDGAAPAQQQTIPAMYDTPSSCFPSVFAS